jgi:hypothetical protein
MRSPATSPSDPAHQAREILYTVVGAGLLGFQRLMVVRQDARRQAEAVLGDVCRSVDGTLDSVEELLPEMAGDAIRQSRQSARDVARFVSVILGLDIATDRPGPTEP